MIVFILLLLGMSACAFSIGWAAGNINQLNKHRIFLNDLQKRINLNHEIYMAQIDFLDSLVKIDLDKKSKNVNGGKGEQKIFHN